MRSRTLSLQILKVTLAARADLSSLRRGEKRSCTPSAWASLARNSVFLYTRGPGGQSDFGTLSGIEG